MNIWVELKQTVLGGRRVVLTSVAISGCVIALRLTGLLQQWEWSTLDLFFRCRPLEPRDDRILVVGIDEDDLQKARQWPISDADMAQLLRKIAAGKPRVIGLDIYRDLPVEPGHRDLLTTYGSLPNLIGIEQLEGTNNPGVAPPPVLKDRQQVGFNNLVYDLDGKIRRGFLYWTVKQKPRKSFALLVALAYLKPQGITPQPATSNPAYLQLGNAPFRRFQGFDGGYVQADDGGYQMLANLRGPAHSFRHVSMSDVLEGRVSSDLIRDRIVLIGSTAVSLRDYFHTSYSSQLLGGSPQEMSGVELQANLISQIVSAAVDGRSLIHVWPISVEWLWILGWAGLGARIAWRLRSPRLSALAILLAATGLSVVSFLALLVGWWVPVVPSLLALAGAAVTIIAHIAHLEEELKRSKEFLNTIINTIPDPIFVKDRHCRWIVLNQAFCRFSGYSMPELLEQSDFDVFPIEQAQQFREHDQRVFASEQEQEEEEELTDARGKTHHIETKRSLHKDAAGNLFLVGVIRDITERKQMEEELKRTAAELVRSNAELRRSATQLSHLANHDTLTGLPNRKLFYERLHQSLLWANANHQMVALLFIDLDGFKAINDSLGHDAGDLLLKALAQRLTNCLRGSDTVSRLGGDEFTVILPAIPSAPDAVRVAEKILKTLAQDFQIIEHTISVTSSIGISLYPLNGMDAEALVKAADTAMYQAKQLGKNCYVVVSTSDG